MGDEQVPYSDRVIYAKPSWIDMIVHLGTLPVILAQECLELFWLIFGDPIRRAFREPDAPLPSKLIDDAFAVFESRMEAHGFVRDGKKRQLVRVTPDGRDRIGYASGKYNERGLRAEFSIWLSATASPGPVRIPWRSGELMVKDQESGDLTVQVNLGNLRAIPRPIEIDLYPRFRRSARTRKAAKMLEDQALPWFEAKRREAAAPLAGVASQPRKN